MVRKFQPLPVSADTPLPYDYSPDSITYQSQHASSLSPIAVPDPAPYPIRYYTSSKDHVNHIGGETDGLSILNKEYENTSRFLMNVKDQLIQNIKIVSTDYKTSETDTLHSTEIVNGLRNRAAALIQRANLLQKNQNKIASSSISERRSDSEKDIENNNPRYKGLVTVDEDPTQVAAILALKKVVNSSLLDVNRRRDRDQPNLTQFLDKEMYPTAYFSVVSERSLIVSNMCSSEVTPVSTTNQPSSYDTAIFGTGGDGVGVYARRGMAHIGLTPSALKRNK